MAANASATIAANGSDILINNISRSATKLATSFASTLRDAVTTFAEDLSSNGTSIEPNSTFLSSPTEELTTLPKFVGSESTNVLASHVTQAISNTVSTHVKNVPVLNVNKGNVPIQTQLLNDLLNTENLERLQSNFPWKIKDSRDIGFAIVISLLVSGIIFLMIFSLLVARRRRLRYMRIPSSDHGRHEYVWEPMQNNHHLEVEYQNTFFGVSVPLLQNNTKI